MCDPRTATRPIYPPATGIVARLPGLFGRRHSSGWMDVVDALHHPHPHRDRAALTTQQWTLFEQAVGKTIAFPVAARQDRSV
jgi:hypothetical protein